MQWNWNKTTHPQYDFHYCESSNTPLPFPGVTVNEDAWQSDSAIGNLCISDLPPPAQLSLTWSSAAPRQSPSYNLGLRTLQLDQNLKKNTSLILKRPDRRKVQRYRGTERGLDLPWFFQTLIEEPSETTHWWVVPTCSAELVCPVTLSCLIEAHEGKDKHLGSYFQNSHVCYSCWWGSRHGCYEQSQVSLQPQKYLCCSLLAHIHSSCPCLSVWWTLLSWNKADAVIHVCNPSPVAQRDLEFKASLGSIAKAHLTGSKPEQ